MSDISTHSIRSEIRTWLDAFGVEEVQRRWVPDPSTLRKYAKRGFPPKFYLPMLQASAERGLTVKPEWFVWADDSASDTAADEAAA